MRSTAAWAFILLLAILLIVAGFQGSFGRILAVVFVPGDLVVDNGSSGKCPPGQIEWLGQCYPNPWGFQ